MKKYFPKSVQVTAEQNEFLSKYNISFTKFVRRALQKEMERFNPLMNDAIFEDDH